MPWHDDLLAQQRDAAGAELGHYLLLAGPGTGKTFVLVRRIQYLVEECNVPPAEITALTFTRAAAAEMRERLEERFQAFRVRVSTLHSFALRELVVGNAQQIQRPVRVVDDYEERWVVTEELARIGGQTVPQVQELLALLADDWDTLSIDGDGWDEGFPDPAFLDVWQRHREVYGYTLRSELVYQLLQELRSNPGFALSNPIQVLLVDEYQDLNRCDLTTIRLLVDRSNAHVYASGDDDQSIYSFRHAHPRGIREFTTDFPDSTQLVMTECHRCGPEIVRLGNWLIGQDDDRLPKDLQSVTEYGSDVVLLRFEDQDDEANGVTAIVALEIEKGRKPEEILVLLRSDARQRTSAFLAEVFAAQGIETYRPRASTEPPDDLQLLLEYLVLSESIRLGMPDSLALRVLLELEQNGVGPKRIRAIVCHALDWRVTFAEAIERLRGEPQAFSTTGINGVLEAVDAIIERAQALHHNPDEGFRDWVARIADALELSDATRAQAVDAADEVIAVLEDLPGALDSAPINYVQELKAALAGLEDSRPTRIEGKVTITSMHGAKGLSADVVFVLQAEDEILPGTATGFEYDEARRLLYVSLTRARKKLFIGACQQRTGPQEWVRNQRVKRRNLTRFLSGYGLTAVTVAEYLDGQ